MQSRYASNCFTLCRCFTFIQIEVSFVEQHVHGPHRSPELRTAFLCINHSNPIVSHITWVAVFNQEFIDWILHVYDCIWMWKIMLFVIFFFIYSNVNLNHFHCPAQMSCCGPTIIQSLKEILILQIQPCSVEKLNLHSFTPM